MLGFHLPHENTVGHRSFKCLGASKESRVAVYVHRRWSSASLQSLASRVSRRDVLLVSLRLPAGDLNFLNVYNDSDLHGAVQYFQSGRRARGAFPDESLPEWCLPRPLQRPGPAALPVRRWSGDPLSHPVPVSLLDPDQDRRSAATNPPHDARTLQLREQGGWSADDVLEFLRLNPMVSTFGWAQILAAALDDREQGRPHSRANACLLARTVERVFRWRRFHQARGQVPEFTSSQSADFADFTAWCAVETRAENLPTLPGRPLLCAGRPFLSVRKL